MALVSVEGPAGSGSNDRPAVRYAARDSPSRGCRLRCCPRRKVTSRAAGARLRGLHPQDIECGDGRCEPLERKLLDHPSPFSLPTRPVSPARPGRSTNPSVRLSGPSRLPTIATTWPWSAAARANDWRSCVSSGPRPTRGVRVRPPTSNPGRRFSWRRSMPRIERPRLSSSCTRWPEADRHSPLQRALRDVHAVTQHVGMAPQQYEEAARMLLGLQPVQPLLSPLSPPH